MSNSSILQQMEAALKEEEKLYHELMAFSQDQFEELQQKEPDTEKVAFLMEQKMEVLDKIRNTESNHKTIKNKWEQEYQSFPPEQRQSLADQKEILMKLIEDLRDIEDAIAEGIRVHEKEINRQLMLLYKNRAISKAYFKQENAPSRYIDKKK